MAEQRYTLMRDELRYVHAHMYGDTRTATTILAAVDALGSAPATLVLCAHTSGADWQLDVPLTIPATVTLLLPPGVFLAGSNNLLILGNVLAWSSDWFQGTGTVTWDGATRPALSALLSTARLRLQRAAAMSVQQQAPLTGTPWTLTWPTSPGTAGQVLQATGGGGSTWQQGAATITAGSITYEQIQHVSASQRLLGRSSPGAGTIEEIVCTPAGRALLDDADNAAQRLTLGIPVGSDSQVQYNAGAVLGASSGLTLNGTQVLTMAFANPGPVRTALGLGTLAVQNANNVDITDGLLRLGGVATHGATVDVQGRDLAPDVSGACLTARLWPYAPPSSTASWGLRVEPLSGPNATSVNFRGLSVRDQPGSAGSIWGVHTQIAEGSNRYSLYSEGTAPTYLNGRVGIKMLPTDTAYALEAAGYARVTALSAGGKTPQMAAIDAYSTVAAPDVPSTPTYVGVRAWPFAPAGTAIVGGLRTEGAVGPGISGVEAIRGIQVSDQPVTTAGWVQGLLTQISAGTNRYNIYAEGTAQNYFAGALLCTGFPATTTRLVLHYARDTAAGLTIQPSADTGSGGAIVLYNAAQTVVGSISTTATTTTYATASDRRLKHNIQPLAGALATVGALRAVRFLWNTDGSPGEGFLADELMQHVPYAVSGAPDDVHPDGAIRAQGVDYAKLVPVLTAALQELTTRVADVEAAVLGTARHDPAQNPQGAALATRGHTRARKGR